MKYIPGLDGLRAMAVLLVIFRHWHFPEINMEFGWIGVNMFFVLSGFLITGILLSDKDLPFQEYLKIFYLKRTLRIFPIYYLYLILITVFIFIYKASLSGDVYYRDIKNAVIHFDEYWPYLFTYSYNIIHLLKVVNPIDHIGSKAFNHLWSLSVEEQFYLVFPFIIYFFSRKTIKILMILLIVVTPLLRVVTGAYLTSSFEVGIMLYKFTPFQLDAFACGAILALSDSTKFRMSGIALAGIIAGLFIFQFSTVYFITNAGYELSVKSMGFELIADQIRYQSGMLLVDLKYAYTFTIINFITFFLIIACLKKTRIVSLLETKPVSYFGKISYGVYLYHNPLFLLFVLILTHFSLIDFVKGYFAIEFVCFCLYLMTTYIVSHLSFQYVEKRFLLIKDKLKRKNKI